VNNVNVTNITNTYNTTVVNNSSVRRVSYNGGSGGVIAQPTSQDRIAARETHTPLLPIQQRHELAASSNRTLLASVNNGHPAVAATLRPERFAAGPAPTRSFSQQAAVHPGALPPRNNAVGVNPRVNSEQQLERRNAPVNAGAPQFQAAPRPQASARAPSQMHPQGSPQAQMHPQGPSQARMQPQGPPQARMQPQGPPQTQMRTQGPPQAQIRTQGPPQAQIRTRGPAHAQAQMQQQGMPPHQSGPQREAQLQHRGPEDRPAEHQHP
jgi:hypothetical protein